MLLLKISRGLAGFWISREKITFWAYLLASGLKAHFPLKNPIIKWHEVYSDVLICKGKGIGKVFSLWNVGKVSTEKGEQRKSYSVEG